MSSGLPAPAETSSFQDFRTGLIHGALLGFLLFTAFLMARNTAVKDEAKLKKRLIREIGRYICSPTGTAGDKLIILSDHIFRGTLMKYQKVCLMVLLLAFVLITPACGAEVPEETTLTVADTEALPETTIMEATQPPEPTISHEAYLQQIRDALPKDGQRISASRGFALGIKPDGTVLWAGHDVSYEDQLSQWTDIVQVTCKGVFRCMGLKSDGTVVSTPMDLIGGDYGQTNIEGWTDITQISANEDLTVGLRKDGTIDAAGGGNPGPKWGRGAPVPQWTGIVKCIAKSSDSVLGITDQGLVVWDTANPYGVAFYETYAGLDQWEDIVDVASDSGYTIGIRKDGTVITGGMILDDAGENFTEAPHLDWKDIVSAAVHDHMLYGLQADGTVQMADAMLIDLDYETDPEYLKVKEWEDI